ncbi:hypothetical protein GBAR_LOCUS15031 [Geodia barretti]|uniref:Secreted protein n=1 Tax=Geodia barretti TaxID=519541 RepID=A0AA35WR55_GEOBA|nr:hypothetical protein GBAR_LOCUS15031 [Geodia barretti]
MAWGTWCCFLCTLAANILLATSCHTWHYYNNATGKCECGFWLHCSSDGNQARYKQYQPMVFRDAQQC